MHELLRYVDRHLGGEGMSGIKRDKLDAIFSDLVRERAGWRCEYSGAGPDSHLECAHIYGRRRRSTRWHPMNAVCLSSASHRYFTENPLAFTNWLKAKFGIDYLHTLAEIAAPVAKFNARQIEGLYRHYLAEFARMELARQNGRGGRIEFSWPDPIIEVEPRKRKPKAKRQSKYVRKVGGGVVLRGTKVNVNGKDKAA